MITRIDINLFDNLAITRLSIRMSDRYWDDPYETGFLRIWPKVSDC